MVFLKAILSFLFVVVGFLIGLASANFVTLVDWLQNWQTLIAGILAVGAGSMTVYTMLRTDQWQDERHRELIRLNLRADRLRVLRAADGYGKSVRHRAIEMAKIAEEISRVESLSYQSTAAVRDLRQAASIDARIYTDTTILACQDLFDASMHMNFCELSAYNKLLQLDTETADELISGRLIGPDKDEILARIKKTTSKMSYVLDRFSSDLEALAESYR